MKDTILYSVDSSYSGISFLANDLGTHTILSESVRVDFDDMIINKSFYNKSKGECINYINDCENIIIFGSRSILHLPKILSKTNKQNFNNFNKITIIISDTSFIKFNNDINRCIRDNNMDVLIMPDLVEYLDKDIPYRIFLQHIPIIDDLLSIKNEEITISHSPGFKYKTDLKGSSKIERILYNYNLDVIYDVPWDKCITRKSKSHIFIDQIVDRVDYKGGIGKSGLEAMLLNCLVITSGNNIICEPTFESPPLIITDEKNLKYTIDYYISNPLIMDVYIKKQNDWALKYLSKDFVIKNILGTEL